MPKSASTGARASGSRVHSEYSLCTAVIGWTACAPQQARVDLRQPQVVDLTLGDELGNGAHRLLYLHVLRRAVQGVQVYALDA